MHIDLNSVTLCNHLERHNKHAVILWILYLACHITCTVVIISKNKSQSWISSNSNEHVTSE